MSDKQIMFYPEPGYSIDFPNQSRMDQLVASRTRIAVSMLLSSVLSLVLFAFTGWPPLVIASFLLLFIGAFISMRRVPALCCTTCGQQMRRKDVPVSCGSDTEEFLVCVHCHRYTFNHRRSIP